MAPFPHPGSYGSGGVNAIPMLRSRPMNLTVGAKPFADVVSKPPEARGTQESTRLASNDSLPVHAFGHSLRLEAIASRNDGGHGPRSGCGPLLGWMWMERPNGGKVRGRQWQRGCAMFRLQWAGVSFGGGTSTPAKRRPRLCAGHRMEALRMRSLRVVHRHSQGDGVTHRRMSFPVRPANQGQSRR